ncbi:velvet factor-domain-containing protein [Auriculariales sp. MPI-PUGE-AT-0066]|nr:velvet factor-domain-containing protein [Auriculariales sp. MPI-PUGE-AT-0066]
MIQHHRGMPPFERVGRAADYNAQQDTQRRQQQEQQHQYQHQHQHEQPPPRTDGPQNGPHGFGRWVNGLYYSLEVIQNPIRARMCGFGDKDRRPLAPAAVAKLVVRDQNNQPVDVNDIDFAFFIAAVDLWSAEGDREVNLVLHPSSADRYIPATQVTKQRRRPTNPSPADQPTASTSSFPLRPVAEPSTAPAFPPFASDGFAFGQEHTVNWPFPQNPFLPPGQDVQPTEAQPPSFTSHDSSGWQDSTNPSILPVRTWGTEQPHDVSLPAPSANDPPSQSSSQQSLGQGQDSTSSMQASSSASRAQGQTSFTRTLVGPLVSNAQKLQDEHRKMGIFFLSRIFLPPAPSRGSTRIHNASSPVLAQIFTDAFTVFSAKRFPGVPGTTDLSIAFGNQGQKLPLVCR